MELNMSFHESHTIERSSHHLAVLLASTHALYLKTHGFHWNVESCHFPGYHELFNVQYNNLFKSLDDIAERMRALGEYVPYNHDEYQTLSMILPSPLPLSGKEMLSALKDVHSAIAEYLVSAIREISETTDFGTADFLTARLQEHEKMLWMITSTIND